MNKHQRRTEHEQRFSCSICHKPSTGFGNNAWPVNSGRCCNACNATQVIPARILNMRVLEK